MPDLLLRVLKHPVDYFGVFNTINLTLQEHAVEDSGAHSFVFSPEKPISWKAGQHSIFTLPERKVTGKKWRAFSIASAPHEKVIRIGTNIPDEPSSFKQELLKLKVGDSIHMRGPFGEFYLKPHIRHVIGVVGGIGITPLRSIIADATFKKNPTPITLLYSAKDKYTYKEELDTWAKENSNLNITYTHTPEEVNTNLDTLLHTYENSAHYFISGSPRMINALHKNCCDKTIKPRNIISDSFKGY